MVAPVIPAPQISSPVVGLFSGDLISFPISLSFSPLVLVILTMLVGIFVAMLSVVLMYHWRRFPFERRVFFVVERVYLAGVFAFLGIAVVGIILSS